jgi:hypothetical protein
MILRLDPRHPQLWRTPWSVQFGIDPPLLRLEEVTETQERLLAALAVGVSRPGLTMIARGRGDELNALLQAVGPALIEPPVERVDTVALSGSGAIRDPLGRALSDVGVHVSVAADAADLAESRPDLAILVHGYVVPPSLHGLWLRRDVPHLAVVSSQGGVTIGPIVEPGVGPCLLCIELHRRDADPAWPAIATQLLGRALEEQATLVLEGAAAAARMALDRLAHGAGTAFSVRIDAVTGRRDYVEWQQHPECGCRGLLPLPELEPAIAGRRETGWAGAALDPVPR